MSKIVLTFEQTHSTHENHKKKRIELGYATTEYRTTTKEGKYICSGNGDVDLWECLDCKFKFLRDWATNTSYFYEWSNNG